MDKLNFLVVKVPRLRTKSFSMDEYLEFVSFNLKYTIDLETNRRLKKASFVNVPFCLAQKPLKRQNLMTVS